MTNKGKPVGLQCPANPDEHGPLLMSTTSRLYCIHQGHDGRPKTHPQGEAPRSRAVFTLDEAEGKVPLEGAAS